MDKAERYLLLAMRSKGMISNRIITTLGRKGQGKSYWCGWAFEAMATKPWVVIDFGMEHFGLSRLHPGSALCPIKDDMLGCVDWDQILQRHYGIVCYPWKISDVDFSQEMDKLMFAVLDAENTLALVDEVHNLAPLNAIRPGFRRVIDQGRKHEIDLICSSLRPAAIDKTLIAQSDELILFSIVEPNALDYLGRFGAPVERLPSLPPRTALQFNPQTGESRLVTAGSRRTQHYG